MKAQDGIEAKCGAIHFQKLDNLPRLQLLCKRAVRTVLTK